MAYGLPVKGQANYDDELNNSIEAVKSQAELAQSTADAAQTSAATAATTATNAKATADQALDFVRTTSDARVAEHVSDTASASSAALGAALESATHPLGVAARASYATADLLDALGLGRLAVYDSFNRVGATLGTADSGGAWTPWVGTFSTDASGHVVPVPSGAEGLAAIDTGEFDGIFEVDYAGDGGGLIFRGIDANNFLFVQVAGSAGNLRLFKRDAGTYTQLVQVVVGDATTASRFKRLRAVVGGDRIQVFQDGAYRFTHQLVAADQTKFGTATWAGVRLPTAVDRADNFVARITEKG